MLYSPFQPMFVSPFSAMFKPGFVEESGYPDELVSYINGLTTKVGSDLLFSSVDSSDPLVYEDGSLYIGPSFVFDATNVLEFSNAGAVGETQVATSGSTVGNGYSVELDESLLECYSGAPDGVELITGFTKVGDDGTNIISIYSDGFEITQVNTDTVAIATIGIVASIGDVVKFDGEAAVTLGVFKIQHSSINGGDLVNVDTFPIYLNITQDITEIAIYRNTTPSTGSFRNLSIQKLAPTPMTTAVLVKMVVASGVVDGSIYSVNDVTTGMLYSQGTISRILRAGDGTNTTVYVKTWAAGVYQLLLMQVSTDGTQLRIGYRIYDSDGVPIDADIVWRPWLSYDGSFDPVDYGRFGLNTNMPFGLLQFQQWNKLATNEEILGLVTKVLP